MSSAHQGLQLFVVREVELGDKVIEMLVAGVDVSLCPHLAHAVKVVDVDVHEHPEQTRQNLLSHLHECLREGSTWESSRWETEREGCGQSAVTFYLLRSKQTRLKLLMHLIKSEAGFSTLTFLRLLPSGLDGSRRGRCHNRTRSENRQGSVCRIISRPALNSAHRFALTN